MFSFAREHHRPPGLRHVLRRRQRCHERGLRPQLPAPTLLDMASAYHCIALGYFFGDIYHLDINRGHICQRDIYHADIFPLDIHHDDIDHININHIDIYQLPLSRRSKVVILESLYSGSYTD